MDQVNEVINSKIQTFQESVKDGFVLFDSDGFPKLLDSNYSSLPFMLANAGAKIKNNLLEFYKAIQSYVELNAENNLFEIEDIKVNELKKSMIAKKILKGLHLFEILSSNASDDHVSLLKEIGSDYTSLQVNDELNLSKYKNHIKGQFDITFSNWLLHDTSGIDVKSHSNVFRSMEMYTIFSNLTKTNGYSIHSGGSYISTLYETFLDFIGFRVVKNFRTKKGPYNFVVILKKYNDKTTTAEEFENIYKMLLSRNPIRYL